MSEFIQRKEIEPTNSKRLEFVSLRPGGNNTSLVLDYGGDLNDRKRINDLLMRNYTNIEQVGFVSVQNSQLNLMMAGGEFCGNATRSAAYLALDGKPGDLEISVSGVKDPLKAGVRENGDAYAQMPVFEDTSKITRDPENPNAWLVEMQGISHYVIFKDKPVDAVEIEQFKTTALQTLKSKRLDTLPAAGVINVNKRGGQWCIEPVVYVRDIDTCFYETACGSGTTAVGEVLAVIQNRSIKDVSIRQPSGQTIQVTVEKGEKGLGYAEISGKIDLLTKGIIREQQTDTSFIYEQVLDNKGLTANLNDGLISLYQNVFAGPPYYEYFAPEEVESIFRDYLQLGTILLARDKGRIIGFAAQSPFDKNPLLQEALGENNIIADLCTYIAELGVEEKYRRNRIGLSLMEELLLLIPSDKLPVLRTNKNNIPAKKLYEQLGFYVVPGLTEFVKQRRTDGSEFEDERMYMIKKL